MQLQEIVLALAHCLIAKEVLAFSLVTIGQVTMTLHIEFNIAKRVSWYRVNKKTYRAA